MKNLSSSILASAILLAGGSVKADVSVSSGTKIYYSDQVPISSFSDSSGIGLGNGYEFTSDYDCSSNMTSNSLNGGIITNQACINEVIKSGSDGSIEIGSNVENASVEIGSGSTPTTINSEGISVGGNNLIKETSSGEIHIGENSWITKEENGRQKVYAKDAAGNPIPIDYTNGTKLLINGRDVDQAIDNVGALSAALTGLPTVPQDSPLACGVGAGAHSGSNALSGGCASKINERLSFNAAASFIPANQEYQGTDNSWSGRAGFVFKLGKINNPTLISMKEKKALQTKVDDLASSNEAMKKANQELQMKVSQFNSEKAELISRLEQLEQIALGLTKSTDLASIAP